MKNPVELDLMRRIKAALDPDDLMNPGVLFSVDEMAQDKEPTCL